MLAVLPGWREWGIEATPHLSAGSIADCVSLRQCLDRYPRRELRCAGWKASIFCQRLNSISSLATIRIRQGEARCQGRW